MFILTTPIVIFYCYESWFHNIVIISADNIRPFVNDTAAVEVVDRLYKLSQVSSRHPFIPFTSGLTATARTIWKNIIRSVFCLFFKRGGGVWPRSLRLLSTVCCCCCCYCRGALPCVRAHRLSYGGPSGGGNHTSPTLPHHLF